MTQKGPGGGFVESVTRWLLHIEHIDENGRAVRIKSDHCCSNCCSSPPREKERKPDVEVPLLDERPPEGAVDVSHVSPSPPAFMSLGQPDQSGKLNSREENKSEALKASTMPTKLSSREENKSETLKANDDNGSRPGSRPNFRLDLNFKTEDTTPLRTSETRNETNGHKSLEVINDPPLQGLVLQRIRDTVCYCCKKPTNPKVQILEQEDLDDTESHAPTSALETRMRSNENIL